MGIKNIGYELKTGVPTFAGNRSHALKAEDFLTAWIADHPTFQAIDAVTHFREHGRTDGACYTALRVLVVKGTLKKLPSGNYTRATSKRWHRRRHQPSRQRSLSSTSAPGARRSSVSAAPARRSR
ncbi:hypothetical protein I6F35_38175 [Bradyrhizobium sp. BRP22]|nr:hypothetical protein [Bradyrhizobium sp. BRP22]